MTTHSNLMAMFSRCVDDALRAPSLLRAPLRENADWYACFCRPFTEIQSLSIGGKGLAVSTVQGLLAWGGPFHVPRLVVTVYINSFNRMLRRWTDTNICKERREGIEPKFNSATAIKGIPNILGVRAPRSGAVKRSIFWRVSRFSSMAVAEITARGPRFGLEAFAGSGVACSQFTASHNDPIRAVTPTQPKDFIPFILTVNTEDGQTSKSLSGKINELRPCWLERLKRHFEGDVKHSYILPEYA